MLYSIASVSPRNVESYGVNTLLPENVRDYASEFVNFLEEYYKYLNGPNGPSLEINNVLHDKDLDNISLKYLDAIQNLIASAVPNSKVLDRVSLYKIIVRYYNSRGSEDNLITMFKIFFNEDATVSYPKELLFESSSSPEKSWPSHQSKIQDSYYWQKFSYVVKAGIDSSLWVDSFNSFLHPAGLKMFYELAVHLFSPNIFDTDAPAPVYNIKDNNIGWIRNLIIESPGQHTPFHQPGWLRELLLRFISQADGRPVNYLQDNNNKIFEALCQLIGFRIHIEPADARNSHVRRDYDFHGFKFKDSCILKDGILDKTIAQANESYNERNGYKFLNLSTIVEFRTIPFNGSYALTYGNGESSPALTYDDLALTLNAEPQNILLHQDGTYAQFEDKKYRALIDNAQFEADPGYVFVYTENGDQLFTFQGDAVQVDDDFANS